MVRRQIIKLLTDSKPELQARFGVTRLALFGSAASGKRTTEAMSIIHKVAVSNRYPAARASEEAAPAAGCNIGRISCHICVDNGHDPAIVKECAAALVSIGAVGGIVCKRAADYSLLYTGFA